MPRTVKGTKILSAMQKEYGKDKGKQVYYASIVKGRVKGAEKPGGTGKLQKARNTFVKEHKPRKKKTYEQVRKEYFGLKK